jgi:hypothetical protein
MKSHRFIDPNDNRARKRCAELLPLSVLIEGHDLQWLEQQARQHETTVSVVVRRLFRRLREVA